MYPHLGSTNPHWVKTAGLKSAGLKTAHPLSHGDGASCADAYIIPLVRKKLVKMSQISSGQNLSHAANIADKLGGWTAPIDREYNRFNIT